MVKQTENGRVTGLVPAGWRLVDGYLKKIKTKALMPHCQEPLA